MDIKYSHKRGTTRILHGKSARMTFKDPLTGEEMTFPLDSWSIGEERKAVCRDCGCEREARSMTLHHAEHTDEEVIAGHPRIEKYVLCADCEAHSTITISSPLTSTTRAAIMHEIVRIPHVLKVHVDDGSGWMRVIITIVHGAAVGPVTARAHDVIKLVKPAGVSAIVTVNYAEP